MTKKIILLLIGGIFLNTSNVLFAQEEPKQWDNQIFLGNKVSWGKNKWKYSGELQTRLIENARTLDRWYIEGVSSYMPNKNWEIVPDLRVSFRPNSTEYRPGIGVLRKDHFNKGEELKHQLVHQVKFQADFKPDNTDFGLRYITFYNNIVSKKVIATGLAGIFYSWNDQFQGI
ncbi:DUF2490 domain-containing protein [Carboxylicivirga sp. M1479]|uniref:DUF2490 domain-containing protein n=1 Tax=Carboxylicivirga sp. M1479 TaxID=2594476 RepID=UPI001177F3C9|nr:DUF2490 domain-containing protein [Carboxylicivirga sp. M1479]TRX65951.1 hypothetical protein FNN09_16300 [Carboxylicivirga sp. M1479]